jgi:site-specific DNA-methyltransferase (adenine-specific)
LKNGVSTITKDEWVEFTNGLWTFAPEKEQKKIGHPAMFPVELPYRLIKMLTYEGDVILDPFMGVATTGVACLKTDRNFIGIEIDKNYCLIGETRLNNYK